MFRCPLPQSSIISRPEAVSLVQKDRCITPLNYLPLDPETNHNANISFTVCIPPQAFPIDREMMLIEWIELNRLLGAERFVFYRHSSRPTVDTVLRLYSERGWAEVVDWTNINNLPFQVDQYGRVAAINDCYRRQRYKSSYIVILDINEYIIPKNRKTFSWKDMMLEIPSIRKGAFVFQLSYFRTDWPDASSNDNITNIANAMNYGLETLLKINREDVILPPDIETKYIVQSNRVKILGVCSVLEMNPDYSSTLVQPSIAFVHKYAPGRIHDIKRIQDDSIPSKYGEKTC